MVEDLLISIKRHGNKKRGYVYTYTTYLNGAMLYSDLNFPTASDALYAATVEYIGRSPEKLSKLKEQND